MGPPRTGNPELDVEVRSKLQEFASAVIAASVEILKGGKFQRDVAYWTQYWMNVVLFVVGLLAFVAALISGFRTNNSAATATFGGLSAATFIGIFISQPLRALQRNATYSAWLSLIINTYWTQVLVQNDATTAIRDLERISATAAEHLAKLTREQRRPSDTTPAPAVKTNLPAGGGT